VTPAESGRARNALEKGVKMGRGSRNDVKTKRREIGGKGRAIKKEITTSSAKEALGRMLKDDRDHQGWIQ